MILTVLSSELKYISGISFFRSFIFFLSFLKFTPSHFNHHFKKSRFSPTIFTKLCEFYFFFWLVLVLKKKKNKIQTMLKRKNTLAYTDIQPFINPFCQGTRTINSHQTRHWLVLHVVCDFKLSYNIIKNILIL
jgi:hypothetical protein